MRLARACGWFLPLVILAAASATAQDTLSPLPGTRLRVTAPAVAPAPIVGTLVQTTDREVILAVPGSERTVVPRADITRVEWSQGRRGHGMKGLLIGAVIGAALLTVAVCSGETCGEGEIPTSIIGGASLGALPGAGIGALIRTERWARLPVSNLRVTASATAKRGIGLGLAWAW